MKEIRKVQLRGLDRDFCRNYSPHFRWVTEKAGPHSRGAVQDSRVQSVADEATDWLDYLTSGWLIILARSPCSFVLFSMCRIGTQECVCGNSVGKLRAIISYFDCCIRTGAWLWCFTFLIDCEQLLRTSW